MKLFEQLRSSSSTNNNDNDNVDVVPPQQTTGSAAAAAAKPGGSSSIASLSEISSSRAGGADDNANADDNAADDRNWQGSDEESSSSSTASWSSSHGSSRSESRSRSNSRSTKSSRISSSNNKPLPEPVLVYHESARSIVFRDNMHRASTTTTTTTSDDNHEKNPPIRLAKSEYISNTINEHPDVINDDNNESDCNNNNNNSTGSLVLDGVIHRSSSSIHSVEIKGFQPQIVPLPRLQLGRNDEFQPLILSDESQSQQGDAKCCWTDAEKNVHRMLMDQKATVKTIKNADWTTFLERFITSKIDPRGKNDKHIDIGPHNHQDKDSEDDEDGNFPYNSFITSTTMLPRGGMKMRSYGTTNNYTAGVVFSLPTFDDNNEQLEDKAAEESRTWSWPSGYSAKTEFNIDGRGELMNGRAEALVSLSQLRTMNNDYIYKSEYIIGGRIVKEDQIKTVPYNEIFLRVGGKGRIKIKDNKQQLLTSNDDRSFDTGVGLPVAIFCRTASFGHLFSLLRTRARLVHIFGETQMKGLPLLMIRPDLSVRVLTEKLQHELLKVAAQHLNPFQNSLIAHKTKIDCTDKQYMQTKLEELIDLDDKIRETLTSEELVRVAGGFGATDESVAQILRDAMIQDKQKQHHVEAYRHGNDSDDVEEGRHNLQDIVNEGLAASVRASDYYTSRQLLILYSLVSSEVHQTKIVKNLENENEESKIGVTERKSILDSKAMLLKYNREGDPMILSDVKKSLPSRPPPPPLDTDRLRSATNSDGLLAVLGAAQILKAMQDGGAKIRTKESWQAVEEWVELGERNFAFRLASWRDQRAAQDNLEIAVDQDSSFMAFVSNKAISNRKNFAIQLHQAVEQTDFNDMRFLMTIDEITNRMHSPCLRLELLQYVLGLDNRYSIEHVKRAIELAATCLNISCRNGIDEQES
ncbi:hypothetical protein FRACYDRAFT_211748 [Fragilariopsis cylindrus CCMP1102]|uniref:Uncharacterized protein n=1 Tax=Fragilariopsis cylindrus CCMP1102 TaxID=635003 RepID=A0A1E7EXR1_9STRA|nr:hypothetical protein FRACYDRAFT_211748 [Fragilariopsis cylindrus CCMP1102]|eukprot:OEU10636.1 hypothetical protein FRACYDRAFT_211748 [Fragilariopsis cylindrus CCMP1102]